MGYLIIKERSTGKTSIHKITSVDTTTSTSYVILTIAIAFTSASIVTFVTANDYSLALSTSASLSEINELVDKVNPNSRIVFCTIHRNNNQL